MQCPSPYWSTPLTPEDRRINGKEKNFFDKRHWLKSAVKPKLTFFNVINVF